MRTALIIRTAVAAMSLLVAVGCLAPRGDSPGEKRAAIQRMKAATLHDLYQGQPSAKELIDKAAGYAVFSNVRAMVMLGGGGAGFGVAVDRQSGQETYMRMAQVGLGLGLGLQDIRVIVVFHSQRAYDNFIVNGWEFGAQADLAATSGEKGAEATREQSMANETTTYALTEAGLAAKANLYGTKYWRDGALN